MSKLNPNAKEFVPLNVKRQSDDKYDDGDDVIFIIRKGKVEEIRLEESKRSGNSMSAEKPVRQSGKSSSNTYRLNAMSAEKPVRQSGIYVNHFFGWTFNQVADFIRSAPRDQVLDILYEAMRQKTYLSCFGVLILYAVKRGVSMEHCVERSWEAFHRFFDGLYQDAMEYEVRWAYDSVA